MHYGRVPNLTPYSLHRSHYNSHKSLTVPYLCVPIHAPYTLHRPRYKSHYHLTVQGGRVPNHTPYSLDGQRFSQSQMSYRLIWACPKSHVIWTIETLLKQSQGSFVIHCGRVPIHTPFIPGNEPQSIVGNRQPLGCHFNL